MSSDDPPSRCGQVQSVLRALTILRLLALSKDGLSLKAVTEGTHLPSSTAHRLLTTMESEGFVRFDRHAGLWRPGHALTELLSPRGVAAE